MRPDSEALTSKTRETVDLSFNRLSIIQGLEVEDPVRGVATKSPRKTGIGRPNHPIIEEIVTFSSDFGENFSHLFHDFKHFLNLLYILKKKPQLCLFS